MERNLEIKTTEEQEEIKTQEYFLKFEVEQTEKDIEKIKNDLQIFKDKIQNNIQTLHSDSKIQREKTQEKIKILERDGEIQNIVQGLIKKHFKIVNDHNEFCNSLDKHEICDKNKCKNIKIEDIDQSTIDHFIQILALELFVCKKQI